MKNRRNYYRILHVQPDTPDAVIRSSYRTMMQKLRMHPDLGGEHGQAALVNEAFSVLSDPKQRARYDEERVEFIREESAPAPVPVAPEPAAPTVAYCCPFCHAAHYHGLNIASDATCRRCRSPLAPAHMNKLESDCQRAIRRFRRRRPLHFYAKWPQDTAFRGETRDVSLNGMRFATTVPVEDETCIRLECDILSAIGRIVSCLPEAQSPSGNWLVGAEFVTLRFEKQRGAFVSTQA